jgi:hypothetical protein
LLVIVKMAIVPEPFCEVPDGWLIDSLILAGATVAEPAPALPVAPAVPPPTVEELAADAGPAGAAGAGDMVGVPAVAAGGELPVTGAAEDPAAGDAVPGEPLVGAVADVPPAVIVDDVWPGISPMARAK